MTPDTPDTTDFWPDCGWRLLQRNAQGWHLPTPAWLTAWLQRPELALQPESCAAETALHRALQDDPLRPVSPAALAAMLDADVRDNYGHFLTLRDALLQAGSLEAWLLALWRGGRVQVPPLFIDLVVQAVLRGLLDGCNDAWQARAAEMLFRPQRMSRHEDRLLAGDRDTLDLQRETHGFGDLGRLLAQTRQPLKAVQLQVLLPETQAAYWAEAARPGGRHAFLLDLTPELRQDLGHGLAFHLVPAHSGLQALAAVLQLWVQHLLGVAVRIAPRQRIDEPQWRWHVGLDVDSTALLNDLYEGREVDAARQARLLGLFRLDFADARDMRADVAGRPVYLGLMASAEQTLRVKPQNLLLNLPLRDAV